jgi:tripartite-type tricarboxylate transporter receptor subunit TctC
MHESVGKRLRRIIHAPQILALPGVQGLRDLGIPNEETILWRALLAPNGAPPARVAQLESAFEKAGRRELNLAPQ